AGVKDYKLTYYTPEYETKDTDILAAFRVTLLRLSVVVVRPGNTRHRWDETCLLDIIVIKSTDVVGMALPVQNINHSTFRLMFEKEKLFGNNFNDWFARLKLVLRVEKKMHVIEQPLPPAPEGKPVADYVLKMKGYVKQLECLSYMLPQDISVGLILNGLTKDFVGFERNYNMHNMGKIIGEIHAMLIEYEKGLPKKAQTPQVMKIRDGKNQKANKKSLKAKGKNKVNGKGKDRKVYIPKPKNPKPTAMERPAKDDACHHCKKGFRIERKLKQGALYLYVGNGVRAQVEAIGSFDIVLPNGLVICLDNCHYAPTITRGVVSVSRLVDNGFVQCFTDYGISVSKNDVLYFNAIARNGIYEIDMHDLVPNVNSIYNVSNKRVKHNLDSTYLWHCHLAHINKKRIKQLQQDGLLKSTDDESFDKCESCLSGKMTKKPFPHSNERAKDLLGIIHTDVCGPLRHVLRQGAGYFITFTDDYSRYGYIYLLKNKHEVFEIFKVFKNEVENQLGKTIKAIRSNRGGEYISQEFKDYLKANEIVQQLTPPYTPQHNDVFERRNHTLLDMKVDKTPYELWNGKVPNLSYLKVWGCEALVKRDTPDKLEQRSVKCIFIGYPKETTGYYFYFPPKNKIVVARYAEFFKKRLISQEISERAVDLEEIQEEKNTTPSEFTSNIPQEVECFEPPQEEVILIRRSERTHRAPNRLCLNVEVEEHSLGDLGEPTNYKAAMLDPESKRWVDAMNTEMQSMIDNMVWVLVDLHPNCKIVGSKWIFKKKTDMDGNVHIYKACLVTKGYTQTYLVDYEEMFSPVADIRAIRILISIAAFYDYEIWQMDVKTAFLNGYLDEDIYMVQPEGFVDPKHPRKVCKLQRSIYGLKQASRSWNKRFDEEVKRFGFAQNLDEPWEVAFILVIKIYRDRSKLLKRYKMDNSKRGTIPMQERLDLNKSLGSILNGRAVDWKSSKQSTIAMSATESEYIAASKAAMEAV
ncbi:retrotransposon protein, putative, ty1-copia subclass, partial [Tanacetum coccineum]